MDNPEGVVAEVREIVEDRSLAGSSRVGSYAQAARLWLRADALERDGHAAPARFARDVAIHLLRELRGASVQREASLEVGGFMGRFTCGVSGKVSADWTEEHTGPTVTGKE